MSKHSVFNSKPCNVKNEDSGDMLTRCCVDIIADTAADVPSPAEHPEWCVGSTCIIADTKEVKILNNQREWV